MGYGDPRSYNPASLIATPNIDRLAREGVRFTDAHSASAVCSPSRYSLLTGEYAWRTRLKMNVLGGYDRSLISAKTPTLAGWLRGHGYSTYAVGKWHLGFGSARPNFDDGADINPETLGFDRYYGIASSADVPPYTYIEGGRYVVPPTGRIAANQTGSYFEGKLVYRAGAIAPGFRHVDIEPTLASKTLSYLSEALADRSKPFFLYFAETAPHTPVLPKEGFAGRNRAGAYADFVEQADDTVGRIMDVIDRSGRGRDTLVIVTSDNGAVDYRYLIEAGHHPNAPWRGQKSQLYEGGHRVPFIARWIGRLKPGVADRTVSLVDVFATIVDLLGSAHRAGTAPDSTSFKAAMLGHRGGPVAPLVMHSGHGSFGIRVGRWKLIQDPQSGGFLDKPEAARDRPPPVFPRAQWQLYDLQVDPSESHNLAAAQPRITERLARLLNKIRARGRNEPIEYPGPL